MKALQLLSVRQQRKAFTALIINKSYAKVKQQMTVIGDSYQKRKWFD